MTIEKVFEGIDKFTPRITSFFPGGIYQNTKNDLKKVHLRIGSWKEEMLTDPKYIKDSKGVGRWYEGFRAAITLIFGLTSGDIESAAIAYGVSTYIIDRISGNGFIIGN